MVKEQLLEQNSELGAEELIEGKLRFDTPSEIPKTIVKRKENPLTKKDIRKLLKKQKKISRPVFDVTYSREQMMLRSMFGGGIGKNVLLMEHERKPQILGILRSGGGLIKSGDNNETASLMGFSNQGGFFIKPRNIQQQKRRRRGII